MASSSDEHYLTTAEVARRLDVKPATVYAYVSRGLLSSVQSTRPRGSLFAQREVDRLVQRGHERRRPSGAVERIATRWGPCPSDCAWAARRQVSATASIAKPRKRDCDSGRSTTTPGTAPALIERERRRR